MKIRKLGRLILLVLLWPCQARGQARMFGIKEELRIANDFAMLTSLAVAPNGQIAVLEWQDRVVHFFNVGGGGHSVFGRPGQGPGEFTRPVAVRTRSNGGWWVVDAMAQRVTVISEGLTLQRTFAFPIKLSQGRTPIDIGGGPREVVGLVNGDTVVLRVKPPLADLRTAGLATIGKAGSLLVLATVDGQLIRQIGRIGAAQGCAVVAPNGSAAAPIPKCPEPILAINSEGTRFAFLEPGVAGAGSYRLSVVAVSGDTVFSRVIRYTPQRIPRSVADTLFVEARRIQPEAKLPEFFAHFSRLMLGRDGTVWLEEQQGAPSHQWLVLTPKGKDLGRVTLAPKVKLLEADQRNLWAIERDRDDVPSIVRLAITLQR